MTVKDQHVGPPHSALHTEPDRTVPLLTITRSSVGTVSLFTITRTAVGTVTLLTITRSSVGVPLVTITRTAVGVPPQHSDEVRHSRVC